MEIFSKNSGRGSMTYYMGGPILLGNNFSEYFPGRVLFYTPLNHPVRIYGVICKLNKLTDCCYLLRTKEKGIHFPANVVLNI